MKTMRMMMVTALAVAASVLGGCGGPKMGIYNLVVKPDSSLKDQGSGKLPPLEVDLVGVKESDAAMWSEYKVDSYFSGNDALRAGAKEYTKSLTFSAGNEATIEINKKDPIWQVWKKRGVTRLFVLASSKNLRSPSGSPELRRKELPLTTDRWRTERIEIIIKSSGIDCPTPMEPLKQ
jgi:hypothetical protein